MSRINQSIKLSTCTGPRVRVWDKMLIRGSERIERKVDGKKRGWRVIVRPWRGWTRWWVRK